MQFTTIASLALASVVAASPYSRGNVPFNASVATQNESQVIQVPEMAVGLSDGPKYPTDKPEAMPARVTRIIDAVKALADNTIQEVQKISQQQDIPLEELISMPDISIQSINKRSVELQGRSFALLLPLVMGLAKVVINGIATVSDAAEVPVLGALLKGAASFL